MSVEDTFIVIAELSCDTNYFFFQKFFYCIETEHLQYRKQLVYIKNRSVYNNKKHVDLKWYKKLIT